MQKKVGGLGASFAKMGRMIGVVGIGMAIGKIGSSIVKLGVDMEQTKISFEVLSHTFSGTGTESLDIKYATSSKLLPKVLNSKRGFEISPIFIFSFDIFISFSLLKIYFVPVIR